jgi:hypothetical protein
MIEAEGKRIDLDMTPAQAMAPEHIRNQEDLNRLKAKRKARAGTQYPLIDVYNYKFRLAMMIYDNEGSTARIRRFSVGDQLAMGITEEMLSQAVCAVGGSLSQPGHYSINSQIRDKLQEFYNL